MHFSMHIKKIIQIKITLSPTLRAACFFFILFFSFRLIFRFVDIILLKRQNDIFSLELLEILVLLFNQAQKCSEKKYIIQYYF